MKKFLKLVLCGFLYACLFSSARSFKKLFKKLTNKKIANNVHSYENTNLFNCINRCEKEGSCKIFNYNPKMKICQLTDPEVDNDYKDAVSSYDWEVYIPVTQITKNDQKKRDTIEVIESKEKLQSAMKMDIYINVTNLSICFWIICLCMLSICLCLIILAKCSIRQTLRGMQFSVFVFILTATVVISLIQFSLEHVQNVWTWILKRMNIITFALFFSNSLAHLYIDDQSKFNDWSINAPTQRIHSTSLMIGFASNGLMFTGFLFDFNVFTKNFTQLQVQMVMKGKSKPTVTWEDVKQRFKNVSTVEF